MQLPSNDPALLAHARARVRELGSQASLALQVAVMEPAERESYLRSLEPDVVRGLVHSWRFWARPKQLAPLGDWAVWLLLAGRGFGKTRCGAEWVHGRALSYAGRWIALVAKTPADARDFMIEGPSGILKVCAPHEKPNYESSKRRITWPNGAWATIYSDEEPDQLRGFSGDTAWLDEFAKFKNPKDCWDNLAFGMREASNDRPRRLITTTPRPIPILKEIKAKNTTVTVTGTSHENRENLDPSWYQETVCDYENTRLGRQEVFAEILEDFPGALWTRGKLDANRIVGRGAPGEWAKKFKRIAVAMDPAAKSVASSAEHGLIVAGLGHDDHGYVLEDLSERCTPEAACRKLVAAYDRWDADVIIGEVNNGGEWIGTTVKLVARGMRDEGLRDSAEVHYKTVTATRGKQTRAEPISTLDEQGRIHHVGMFPELEDQMCTWDPNAGMASPDRMDARVWAFTELMLKTKKKIGGLL